VPIETIVRRNPATIKCDSKLAVMIIDLETNPEKKGKAETEIPPITRKNRVLGIFLYKPPRSVNFDFPVAWITAPAAMNSKPL